MCVNISEAQLAQFLVREALTEQVGWADGVGVSVGELRELIDEWDDDEEDEFMGALEALEEAGWLACETDACGNDDVLYYCGTAS